MATQSLENPCQIDRLINRQTIVDQQEAVKLAWVHQGNQQIVW